LTLNWTPCEKRFEKFICSALQRVGDVSQRGKRPQRILPGDRDDLTGGVSDALRIGDLPAHIEPRFKLPGALGVDSVINSRRPKHIGALVAHVVDIESHVVGHWKPKPRFHCCSTIAGPGMQGTLAAGELATSPERFKQVVDRLGNKGGELPYFEVVLKAEMMGSTVHGFKLVAWRSS
jgi:hypothetical protein